MSTASGDTVSGLLGALHAERLRSMDPAALRVNIEQRRTLVETADRAGFVKAGNPVQDFALAGVDGANLSFSDLVARGPAVLIFFRFAGCPACNIAVPFYDRALRPAAEALGARVVAVSPQVPERLVDIKTRHGLALEVASDPGNALARRFGILYAFDEASRAASRASGTWIGEVTGTGTWELPMPAIVVIGPDRTVWFADVTPDWMARTEPGPVLAALTAHAGAPLQDA